MHTTNVARARSGATPGRHTQRERSHHSLQARLAQMDLQRGHVPGPGDGRQRLLLRAGDAAAIFVSFTLVMLWLAADRRPDTIAGFAAALAVPTTFGVWAVRYQGLWVERINSVRAIELSRLTRAVVIFGIGVMVFDRFAKFGLRIERILTICAIAWIVLIGWRSVYRVWLQRQRRRGSFVRRVFVIGTDERAIELVRMFADHPDAGVRVVGVVGSEREARLAGLHHLWVANYRDADEVLSAVDVDGVVLCSTDINPALLESLVRQEQSRRRDLYLDSGLPGIDFRRLEAIPIAHQPLLFVETTSLSQLQVGFKRVFDIAVSVLVLALTSPIFIAIALLVKLSDGGPIFFSQQRVGKGGETFPMRKFRTMVVDAEARLAQLQDDNQRRGPLFKMESDPRITRVGGFLRKTSLDELPQLLNVISGQMSLVGPRPALPKEVAEFPPELLARHLVRPGITGLWQVEARDNPSFDAYRRLDLFYVENWSLALDLIIMLGTVDQVLLRPWLRPVKLESDEIAGPELLTA